MMWLSIRLPQLPLEALHLAQTALSNSHLPNTKPSARQTAHQPVHQAVIEDNHILSVNAAAYEQGVRVGQKTTSVFAFCQDIQLFERKLKQEQQQLENLALIVYPISSAVIIETHGLLILEIGGSLKLYKGFEAVLKTLTGLLDNESISYQIGIGNNPKSAEILSYLPFSYSFSMIKDDVVDSALLKSKLCKLPIELMQISQKTIKKISSVGFKTINDIHKLPHHALQKRFGSESLEYLLKLFNQLADPRKHFTPAEFFQQRLEFNEVVHHRQGLLFPIKRLLENLVRFLHLQQKNVQSLKWKLFDSGKGNICFEVVFSNAGINYKNYLELTQLNLEQHKLKEPIEAIELLAEELSPLEAISQTLFEQVGEFCSNPHFINKIRAKLGNNSCQIIQPLSSHLPELCSINQDIIMEVKFNNSDKKGSYKNLNKQESNANNPTWLLTHPQPLSVNNGILQYNGKLTIISSAKKLTTHWWKKNTARNYYISEHESGGYYWVFYDLIKKHWFLHGIYG